MRVNPNQSGSLVQDMQSSQAALSTAVDQLASGKRVTLPSDDPTAFSANLRTLAASAAVDRYTQNAGTVVARAQMADSALSSVITSLTQAVSVGTAGAGGTLTVANRAALGTQVGGILANVLAQANLSSNGLPLFGGTAAAGNVFTADPTAPGGFTYTGTDGVNQTAIGDGLSVAANIPGNTIFLNPAANVLGSLQGLANALNNGSTTDIATATAAVSTSISHVSQQRVVYANTVTEAEAQESFLSQETLSLSSQASSLTGIDFATAATNLAQAQTAHAAVLAVAAKVLPVSLLDYLK